MQNSPGKVRRIFHKKRQAFEKKNPPQPPDFTTRLNKVHQDFAALQSIAAQILARCDALDGVKDGVMDDPRLCKVDVASLTGLTPAQQSALKAIYAPTRAEEPKCPGVEFVVLEDIEDVTAKVNGAVKPGMSLPSWCASGSISRERLRSARRICAMTSSK